MQQEPPEERGSHAIHEGGEAMNADVFIRKLEALAPLAPADRNLLQTLLSSKIDVSKGRPFVQAGDTANRVHVLLTGMACRYKMLTSGKRQISALVIPGDFCDAHALILKRSDHAIAALCDCTLAQLTRAQLEDMLRSPAIAKALLFSSLVEASVLREWVGNIGQRPAVQRMAHLFCEIYIRMKFVGLSSGERIELPLSQTELSDSLGLSLVHTNKSLRVLREHKLLEFKSGSLIIFDIDGLKNVCRFDTTYLHL